MVQSMASPASTKEASESSPQPKRGLVLRFTTVVFFFGFFLFCLQVWNLHKQERAVQESQEEVVSAKSLVGDENRVRVESTDNDNVGPAGGATSSVDKESSTSDGLAHASLDHGSDRDEEPDEQSFPAHIEKLKAWLTEQGGRVSPNVVAVECAFGTNCEVARNDRGLVAGVTIQESEVLVYVSANATIHRSKIAHDPAVLEVRKLLIARREKCTSCKVLDTACRVDCDVLSETTEAALWQVEMAVWLGKEQQDPHSHWRAWLDLLPSDFSSMPLALNNRLLRIAFAGTELLDEAIKVQAAWHAVHNALTKISVTYRGIFPSWASFLKARLLVLSRVHGLSSDGVGAEDTFVPFADLLNHDANAPTWWGPAAGGGFLLKATAPITEGTPITCSYGAERSSQELLLHYGFAPAKNPSHHVALMLAVDRMDPLYAAKREALLEMNLYRGFKFGGRHGFASSGRTLTQVDWDSLSTADGDKLMFGEVLTFLRVAALELHDLKEHSEVNSALLQMDSDAVHKMRQRGAVIDKKLEQRAAAVLEGTCNEYLDSRGGDRGRTAEDILADLRAEPPDENGPDLPAVAAGAANLLLAERELYLQLRGVARAVQSLIQGNEWPEVTKPMSELDTMIGVPGGAKYVTMWAQSFSAGLQ